MAWVYYYDKVLLAMRRIMIFFKKCHRGMFVIVLMLGSLFLQVLPAFVVNYGNSRNHAGNKANQEASKPETSASAPFTPSVTFDGAGSNLLVNDSFNGTIKNDTLSFQSNQNMTVPIIAPGGPIVPAANISQVVVKLHPINVSPVLIPWNTSISRQNKTMPYHTIAQTFSVDEYSTISNVSIRGLNTSPLSTQYRVNVTIIQGTPILPIKVITQQQWPNLTIFPPNFYYSFNINGTSQWYDFDIPSTFINPGLYSVIYSVIPFTDPIIGNLSFCLVNGTRFPGNSAFNYTVATGWQPILDTNNATLDFSIKVGLHSSSDEFLSNSLIQARIGTGIWKNFTKTGHDVILGQAEGAPWVPTVKGTGSFPLTLFFGIHLILRSNNSMQVNASINITYFKHGYYATTAKLFTLFNQNIAWNGTYNATIPRWNEIAINNTYYTLHVQPSTQVFAIAMPTRWQAINITRPLTRSLGKVPAIIVTNASKYIDKFWQFVALSTKMQCNLLVNGTKFSNGDTIHFAGTMNPPFSSTYTGNASFWLNQTKEYWSETQSFSGSTFSFTQGFQVPSDAIVLSGYYTCMVIADNGTDIGCNATGIAIVYAVNAHVVGNVMAHDIEGPFGRNISVQVRLEINKTGTGLSNATINSTWGMRNVAWWYTNVTGKPGEYLFYFNTSAAYCNPGASKQVTIIFTRPDIFTTYLNLTMHLWKNSSLFVQPHATSVYVNQTVPVYVNYTDASNIILRENGPLHVQYTYSLGSYNSTVLNFQVFNKSAWTFVLGLNTTLIPRVAKAGNYTLMLHIQAKYNNGTWFHPQSYNASIHVLVLPLSWNITRLDASFNDTLGSLQITEFEGVASPSTFWVRAYKTVHPDENASSIVNATGVTVLLDFNNASNELVEDGARHGLYKGIIDLTSMAAPQVLTANVTIMGNDVGSKQFTIQIHLIKRYILNGELVNPPESFTENQQGSLRFKLSYVDMDGVTHVYANKKVKVHLAIFDGSITIPFDYVIVTDGDGQILIANISIPKVARSAEVSLQINVVGDKSIDPSIAWIVTVPIVQDFWYRNGLTIFLIIVIAAIGIALFIKQGIPRLKLRREETKIAVVKTRQDTKLQGKIKFLDGGADPEPIDIDVLESNFEFPTMHTMPPEVIDLDLRSKSVKRSRGSRNLVDSFKISNGSLVNTTDLGDLVREKTETIEKAVELEAQGDLAGAIEYFKKVVEIAKKLAHDDDAFTYEKKVEDLSSKLNGSMN